VFLSDAEISGNNHNCSTDLRISLLAQQDISAIDLTGQNNYSIESIACFCPLSLPISGTIPFSLYQAENDINSNGTVPTGNNVQFKAGQVILLDNDFTVEPNADFSAEIDGDCDN